MLRNECLILIPCLLVGFLIKNKIEIKNRIKIKIKSKIKKVKKYLHKHFCKWIYTDTNMPDGLQLVAHQLDSLREARPETPK